MKPKSNTKKPVSTIQFYDKAYIQRFQKSPIKRIENLISFIELSPFDKVVDFGCGSGLLLQLIHDKISEYSGVDFSPDFILLAEAMVCSNEISNARFYCSDIIKFCHEHSSQFDKAFSLDFSEHIYDEDFSKIYSAIYSTLKPSGTLYLHTPNGRYFLEFMKSAGIIRQLPEHVAVRDASTYLELLSQAGFSDIKIRRIPHYLAPMKWFHFLAYIPLFQDCFGARLFITAKKQH